MCLCVCVCLCVLTSCSEMGCRLPKLRKAEERQSPGNIYSTLRRPQVETKVGVAYTYHFLDFLLGKEGTNHRALNLPSEVRSVCPFSHLQFIPLWPPGFVFSFYIRHTTTLRRFNTFDGGFQFPQKVTWVVLMFFTLC